MRSKRRKQKGVGEWMVAQMVIPVFISPFTTLITCAAHPYHIVHRSYCQTKMTLTGRTHKRACQSKHVAVCRIH